MNEQIEIGGPGAEVARKDEVTVPAGPVDMARIMALAEGGVDPDTVGRMIDLYERVHGIQANQAFNQAMLAVQQYMDAHPVPCRGKVIVSKSGTTRPYPLLEDIQRTLNPVCAQNGISYGFDTEMSGRELVLLMHIRHVMGHSETVRTTLPVDSSGSKNPTQGVGSTESYGMRYGIIKGFSLTRYLHDDDAASAGSEGEADVVDAKQLANLQAVWDEVKKNVDEKAFLAYYDIALLADMPKEKYQQALQQLERKR